MTNNIKNARERLNMTQQDCADYFEVGLRAWQTYEQGRSEPKNELLVRMADYFHVTTDYLLGRSTEEQNAIDRLAGEFNMSALEKKIMEGYVNLPVNMRTDLMDFLHRSVLEVIEEEKSREYISVSFADYPVSAGLGDELENYEQWDKRSILKTDKTRKADFVIRVSGDSMEPMLFDGDYIAVKKQEAVDIGQIGVFCVDGKGYVKKLGENCLISLNDKYDDIQLTEDTEVRCFGLVLDKVEFKV